MVPDKVWILGFDEGWSFGSHEVTNEVSRGICHLALVLSFYSHYSTIYSTMFSSFETSRVKP